MNFCVLVSVVVCLSACAIKDDTETQTGILNGQIDLQGQRESVALSGLWAFWPDEFIDAGISPSQFSRFERFPSSWSSYRGEALPSSGFASYAVTVKGLNPNTTYALRFPAYSSAARYFINGTEIYSQGVPASDLKAEKAFWSTAVVPVPSLIPINGQNEFTLVMHISNYCDLIPAGRDPIFIGTLKTLEADRTRSKLFLIIPFGIILAMSSFFLTLFAMNHTEHSYLWLGLLGLIFALRILCYDEYLLAGFIPWLTGVMVFRLGYLTFALAGIVFCRFIKVQFPKFVNAWVLLAFLVIFILYSCCAVITQPSFFTSISVYFQILNALFAGYVTYVSVRSVLAREFGSLVIFAGLIVFFFFGFRDAFVANRIIEGRFLAHYGVLGIITSMGIMTMFRFNQAFNKVESTSGELERVNETLRRFVPTDFFHALGKTSITDVCVGDTTSKFMCVMFINLGIDLSDDTAGSRLNLLELFNNTLVRINPVIQRFGGFIDKYLDDGVMALFPDDSIKAVSCALEIQRCINEYNAERRAESLPLIRFSAGIHCDKLLIGTIGEEDRIESAVISDAVGFTSQLVKYADAQKFAIAVSYEIAMTLGNGKVAECVLIPHGKCKLSAALPPVLVFEVRSQ